MVVWVVSLVVVVVVGGVFRRGLPQLAGAVTEPPGPGPGSGDEPGQCHLPLRVRQPLGAAVRPQRPPGPGRAVQAAALLPPVPVLPGLR